MKYLRITYLVSATIIYLTLSITIVRAATNDENILKKAVKLQLPFMENKGQLKSKEVKYYAKTFSGTVFITKNGELVYNLPKFEKDKKNNKKSRLKAKPKKVEGCVLREKLIGADLKTDHR